MGLKENIKVKDLIDKKSINKTMALIETTIKIEEIKMLMVFKKIIEMMMQAKIEERDFNLEDKVKEVFDKIEMILMIDHMAETQMREVKEVLVRIEIIIQMIEILIVQVGMIDQNLKVDQKDLIDIKEMINLIKEIEVNTRVGIDLIDQIDQKDQTDKRDPIDQTEQKGLNIELIDQINKEIV